MNGICRRGENVLEIVQSKQRKMYVVGIVSLLASAILTSISQVYYANKVQLVHPFLFTGISFFITAIFFQMVAMKQRVQVEWKRAFLPLLKLNLASVLAFMGFYFALKYIEPAIVSSLEMGVGPLFVLVIALRTRVHIPRIQWWIALGTLGACLLLIYAIFSGNSGVTEWRVENSWGIVTSIFCGLGAVLCTIYSKQLSTLGWSSSMILSKRFIAIIILSFIATYDTLILYFLENIAWIMMVTIMEVLIPMYLLQKGIQYCETFIVMMSLCFILVFTFFFQLLDPRLTWSSLTFTGVCLLLILGILSMWQEQKNV